MNNPLVSVIVPIYNVESYLDECIASIVNQSYTNLEILLLDDGSPDGCGSICDRWAAQDDRIQVVHKGNSGVSDTRNLGIRIASGAYLLMPDSDDYLDLNAVSTLVQYALQYQAQCVLGGYSRLLVDGHITAQPCTDHIVLCRSPQEIQEQLLPRLLGGECQGITPVGPSACTKFYSRQSVLDSGAQFLDITEIGSEDFYFNVCFLSRISSAVLIPETFYFYRQNPSSCSNSYRPYQLESFLRLYSRLESQQLLPDAPQYQQMLAANILGGISVCVKLLIAAAPPDAIPILKALLNHPDIRKMLHQCKLRTLRSPALMLFCMLLRFRAKYTLFALIKLFLAIEKA